MDVSNIIFSFQLDIVIEDEVIENILFKELIEVNRIEYASNDIDLNKIINDPNISKLTKLLLVDRLFRELMQKIYSLENRNIPA